MYFYEVLVSSPQFHGKEALTYSSTEKLLIGSIVNVQLRRTPVAGMVVAEVPRPSFATKPLTRLIATKPIPPQLSSLLMWLKDYYPAPLGIIGQLALPSSLVRKREIMPPPPALYRHKIKDLPQLSAEQQSALELIEANPTHQTFLLHGNTGTGKTRLYIELALKTLTSGKSVLILTPEIGLTPQLRNTLHNSLHYPVMTLHSDLTPTDRRTVWLQILQATDPIVVIGPRSALFAPISQLGLLVVDEAHDQAYKQEQAPHYQALRVASRLAAIHHAKLIIGSATPLITDYYLAETKNVPIIHLKHRPAGHDVPRTVEIINLRDRQHFSRQPHLSNPLLNHIHRALQNNKQALVFLNRRGTARLVLCQLCGWTALCPHCDLPLTYHGDSHTVRCHTCGYHDPTPTSCPECNSSDIIFKAIGTKSIVAELQKEFPHAIIRRFDTDNHKTESLEQHYQDVLAGNVDILVGTQMLAKGLDLPKLAVVGVVVADTSLYFPDYTAEEHTYQLLTQVIGRVGRGHTKGAVVIQTYEPTSPAIQAAVHENWQAFYASQLKERQAYGFPPFYHYLKLSCTRTTSKSAQTVSEKLVAMLQTVKLRIIIVGPSPSFHEKQAGKYCWQIIVKAKDRKALLAVIALLPAGWNYDLDPSNLL